MNTHAGYSKKTLTDTNVLLAGGGDKSLADFLGGIQYVSASNKIQYRAVNTNTWTDLVTLIMTDENVKQTPKTDNVNRPLMMINGGTSTGTLTSTSIFSTGIYANASTKMITAAGFIKTGSDNTSVLLAGGGAKALSDFAMSNAYLPLAGGTMTGNIGMGGDSTKFLISSGSSGANSPLRGNKMPATSSNWIGLFARPGKSTDEGGLLLSEDTCVIYNSHDTGWGFLVVDTDLSQSDWSVTTAQAFGVNSSHQAWALGGFVKSGSDDTYVLLGGGGHKALSDFSMAHSHPYLPLSGGTLTGTLGKSNNYLIKPVADYRTSNDTHTGCITITLPATIGNTMVSMWIDVYNYSSNTSFSVHCGGYTYHNSTWQYNPFAIVYGASHRVRLGHNGTSFVIYIGETNSSWSYPQVTVRDVILGYDQTYVNWYKDWTISFVTSVSNVTADITRYAITTDNIGLQSVNYANSAGSVAWANISDKPINFKAYHGSLASGGWKTMQGKDSSPSIAISYNNGAASWNSGKYSATLVYGCTDTRGLLDCAHNTPIVTFGGGWYAGSTDDNPAWYMKIFGTNGTTYDLNSMPYAISAGSATNTYIEGASGNVNYPLLFTTATANGNGRIYADNQWRTAGITFNPSTDTLNVGSRITSSYANHIQTSTRFIDAGLNSIHTDHGLYIGYGAQTYTAVTRFYYSTGTTDSTSSRTEFMRINSNGAYALTRFGVNGQNTGYTLHVNGTGNFENNIWVRGSGVYLRLGPQNSSFAHYETDASVSHWFNKRVDVNGAIWRYNTNYGIADDGRFYALSVYANRSSSSTDGGVSLYSNSDPMTYGIAFRGTETYGKFQGIQSDWATYLTMNNDTSRGWMFRRGSTNVLAIDGFGSLNRFYIYRLRLPGATAKPVGWYQMCRISGLDGYFNFNLLMTGGWSTGAPTMALLNIACYDTTPVLTQICGKNNNIITKIRLRNISGDNYYLDVYQAYGYTSSNAMSDEYFLINGSVKVTEIAEPTAVTSATGGTELDIYNISGHLVDSEHTHDDRYTLIYTGDGSYTFTSLAAANRSSVGMINPATDNPTGGQSWVHCWSQTWAKGSTSNWVSQIALGTERGVGMWYRCTSGNIAGRAWIEVLDTSSTAQTKSGNLTCANFYTTSDRNKKQNISSFSEHIRKFQLKDTEKWHYGVIAQEVPEMFRDGEEGNMTVNYNSVLSFYIGLLENRVKELEERIRILEKIKKD